jgi:hypothetical protein
VSASFSLLSWASRIWRGGACISARPPAFRHGESSMPYYALAEDWSGRHCPYPRLPAWGRALFDWKMAIDRSFRARSHAYACERFGDLASARNAWRWDLRALSWFYGQFIGGRWRGANWWFHCAACGEKSYFSLRGEVCRWCGKTGPPFSEPERRFDLARIELHIARWFMVLRQHMEIVATYSSIAAAAEEDRAGFRVWLSWPRRRSPAEVAR